MRDKKAIANKRWEKRMKHPFKDSTGTKVFEIVSR
jgi:hypothetical protein